MPRIAKTEKQFIIQGHYGQGWEDESSYLDRKEALADLKAYRANSPYPSRLITRRVPVSPLGA